MPRLLIATTVPVTLTAFLLPFAAHFRGRGWPVDAMANGISADEACADAFDHVWEMPWSRNPLHPRNFLATPKRVREIVTGEGYDLVHVHTPVASFVTRLALLAARANQAARRLHRSRLPLLRRGPAGQGDAVSQAGADGRPLDRSLWSSSIARMSWRRCATASSPPIGCISCRASASIPAITVRRPSPGGDR